MSHVKPVGGVFEFQDFGAGTLGCVRNVQRPVWVRQRYGAKNSEGGDESSGQTQITQSLAGPLGRDKLSEPYSGNNMRST